MALAALATALSPITGSQAVPRCPDEARRVRPDGWTQLNRPAYSLGPSELRAWAASPFQDGYLLATNGDAVARSLDGGCSWEETYTPGAAVGEARLLPGEQTIYDVAMPPSPRGRLGYLSYALIADVDGTRVITTGNLGETWDYKPSVGLPPIVTLHGMWVSPNPNTAFVLVDSRSTLQSVVETTLYVTNDAGLTFKPVTRGLQPRQYRRLALDPIDARNVWAWDEDSVFRSTDGGTSFFEVDVPGRIGAIDILHFPAYAPARVVVYSADSASSSVSDDGGLTWRTEPTPGRVTGTANAYDRDALVMASEKGVHFRAPGFVNGLRPVSPRGLRVTEVAMSLGDELTVFARSQHDLYLRRFTPALAPLPPVKLRGGAVIKPGPTKLTPADKVLSLRVGQKARVPYTLDLAPVPTPLDIFFATDSTGSMAPVIAGLRQDLQDIIDDLGDSGIDVWFGVGDFKDYSTHGTPGDHPYKRYREVGPIDDDLATAIESIQIGGGNGLDSALTATYQAATGAGQAIVEGSPQGPYWVEPGQGAEWRPNSLRVVVIAADVKSRDPQSEKGYPGPSYAKVIGALNRLGVEHVGLAVGDFPDQPRQSLSRVSRGTGTVAPEGGIDCDDDGEIDLVEGEPLVCELPVDSRGATNLSPAVVGLLRSLQDLQPVGLTVTGDRRVAKIVSPPIIEGVNVKATNRLDFTVEASCDASTVGKSFPVAVQAKAGPREVAATKLTVQCEAPPKKAPRIPPEVPSAPLLGAVIAPVGAAAPPPPPPPAPIPQAQPQGNPNPNPNPQVQPNVGMAHQEQTQVELALATNDVTEDGMEELAMVGLAAGAMMAAACSVALRRRERTAVARSTW